MTTKLRIDLSQGILEVEGSEAFVRTIYQDFKIQFLGEEAAEEVVQSTRRRKRTKAAKTKTPPPEPVRVEEPVKTTETVSPTPPVMPTKPPIPAPTYNYIEDLKLGHTTDNPSLVEFMDSKLPITNEERNLVFLYYLQHIIKHKPITLDHIYTCYREVNIRAPLNIENSLQLTANHQNWIKITKTGNMSTTPAGKLYVEKELPKKTR